MRISMSFLALNLSAVLAQAAPAASPQDFKPQSSVPAVGAARKSAMPLVIEGDARDDAPERVLRSGLDDVKREQIRLESKLDALLERLRDDRRPQPRLEIAFETSPAEEGADAPELGLVELDATLNEIPIASMRRPLFLGRDRWSLPLFDGPARRGAYTLRMRVSVGPPGGSGVAGLGRHSLEKDFPIQLDEADKKIAVRILPAKAESGKAPAPPVLEAREL